MSKIDTLIKLAGKFKSDLRQQYKDSMGYPDAGEIARRKAMGDKSPREKINEAFNYIESSKNPDQARNRAEEMFGEFDIDGAIEEAGGFEKAFKTSSRRDMKDVKPPAEKANGGLATSRSRKPRGVGAALRGYGKALK